MPATTTGSVTLLETVRAMKDSVERIAPFHALVEQFHAEGTVSALPLALALAKVILLTGSLQATTVDRVPLDTLDRTALSRALMNPHVLVTAAVSFMKVWPGVRAKTITMAQTAPCFVLFSFAPSRCTEPSATL